MRNTVIAAVDAVASDIQDAARQELDALRSSISARLTALERALDRNVHEGAFDPVIQKLCAVADEHADIASSSARAQEAETAARELAAVREQAHTELDAARAQSEAALAQAAEAAARELAAAREQAHTELDAVRAQSEAARAQAAKAAARELAAAREQAHTELDAARAQSEAERLAYEQQLTASAQEKIEAALALAEADRVAALAAQRDAEMSTANLEETRAQITRLERERAELEMSRNIAEAHLEGDVHKRNALAAELEAARETALQAKADADGARLELQRTTDRLRILEERRPLGAEPPTNGPAATSDDAANLLDKVSAALQTLAGAATTGPGLLDAVLDLLAEHFSRTAICVVGARGCVVWGSRGFDPPLANSKTVVPVPTDSPLMRASADSKSAMVRVTDGQPLRGLLDRPIGYAIALPIAANDQGIVMVCAENAPEWSGCDPDVAAKLAAILADDVRRRLRLKHTAPAAERPDKRRRDDRVA